MEHDGDKEEFVEESGFMEHDGDKEEFVQESGLMEHDGDKEELVDVPPSEANFEEDTSDEHVSQDVLENIEVRYA